MKIAFTIITGCIALTMMSFLIGSQEPPLYKNLKILPKDITKEQMDSVMHHFAGSMGQKCNFCHAYNPDTKKMDFASDEKEQKETARYMWKMTAKLNSKFFEVKDSKNLNAKLQVTCFTCHHGDEHPETKPQVRMEHPAARPSEPMAPTDSTKH